MIEFFAILYIAGIIVTFILLLEDVTVSSWERVIYSLAFPIIWWQKYK